MGFAFTRALCEVYIDIVCLLPSPVVKKCKMFSSNVNRNFFQNSINLFFSVKEDLSRQSGLCRVHIHLKYLIANPCLIGFDSWFGKNIFIIFFTTGRTEAQIGLEYDIVKGQVRTSQGGQGCPGGPGGPGGTGGQPL